MKLTGYIKGFLLAIYLLLGLRILMRTPFEDAAMYVEATYEVMLVIGFAIYLLQKAITKTVSRFEAYIIVICILPFTGAFTAGYHYDQPLIYGLLAQRDFYLCLSAIFLFNALKTGFIPLDQLRRVLLGVSWFCLIAYTIVNFTVNPAPFKSTGFVGYNPLKGGYIFRFNMSILIFATFYYFTSFVKNLNKLHALYFVLFFAYIALIRQDRTIVLTLIVGLVVLIIRYVNLQRSAYILSIVSAFGIIIFAGLYVTSSDFISKINDLYVNSLEVVMNLGAEEEMSGRGTIRIVEAQIAADGFAESPILGRGALSRRYEGGFNAIHGHFYPADVGILGVLFLYGIFGTALVFFQSILVLQYGNTVLRKNQSVFLVACFIFLIQFYLNSLTDGNVVLDPAVSLLFICPLYYVYYRDKSTTYEPA